VTRRETHLQRQVRLHAEKREQDALNHPAVKARLIREWENGCRAGIRQALLEAADILKAESEVYEGFTSRVLLAQANWFRAAVNSPFHMPTAPEAADAS
jgi:hypothetical protein